MTAFTWSMASCSATGERVDEPYISVPAEDGQFLRTAYQTARDDFPRDLEGIAAESAANNAAGWSVDIKDYIHVKDGEIIVPPNCRICHGRQPAWRAWIRASGALCRRRT